MSIVSDQPMPDPASWERVEPTPPPTPDGADAPPDPIGADVPVSDPQVW